MIKNIPLLIVPFILYNLVLAGAVETGPGDPFAQEILSVGMMSGGRWTMSLASESCRTSPLTQSVRWSSAKRRRSSAETSVRNGPVGPKLR